MGRQYWSNPLIVSQTDGPTITAASRVSCLPPAAKYTLPNNFWEVPGKMVKITAAGRISCVVTAPGTARFDVGLGAVVAFDSLAIPLNIVAKTNVSWYMEILLTCRTIGQSTAATLMGQGFWTSEAGVGAQAAAVAAPGSFLLPYAVPPAVGGGFDSTSALALDFFFTQTVTTGSMTLHTYILEEIG